uniref:Flavin-containing monooxygenase n=1 Tax=Romanomermis culicivorax TaxID=13658 RepID=A0A915JRE3_ROMCU
MKIAVIGAGLSGLVSMKECIECGLEVVCFEKSNVIGGLWHYRDDGSVSVSKKTVSLTSKHLMAFSDFPMPEEFPEFLHNKYYLKYLLSYAEKYRLKDHVKFNTVVKGIAKNDDYEKTGRWSVTFVQENKPSATEIFDGVFVASGRYREIFRPHFEGVEKFTGRLFNCQTFKNAAGFENRSTLVVGFGHTACETASVLASVSSQCANKKLISNKTQVVSDELPFYISSGQVVVKPNVKKFTGGNEVQFEHCNRSSFVSRELGLSQAEIRELPYLDDLAIILGTKPKI